MRILKIYAMVLGLAAALAGPVFGQADTTILFDPATGEVGEDGLVVPSLKRLSYQRQYHSGSTVEIDATEQEHYWDLTPPGTFTISNIGTDTNQVDFIYLTINASVAGTVTNITQTLVKRSNWGNLVQGENEIIMRRRHDGSYLISQDTGLLNQDQVKDLVTDQAAQDAAIAGKADAVHTHSAPDINSGTLDPARLAGGTATAGYVPKSNGDGTATWAPDANDGSGGSSGITATGSTTDDTLTSLWSYTIPANSSVSVEAWLTGGGSANDVMLKQVGHFVRRDASASLRGTNDVEIIPSDTTMVAGWKLEGDALHYYVTGTNEPMNWTATISTNLVQNAEAAASYTRDGLVMEWLFTEGAGTTVADSSGNGNDGAIMEATWATVGGETAVQFDGVNDIITAPISLPAEPFTIIVRARLDVGAVSGILFGQSSGGRGLAWYNNSFDLNWSDSTDGHRSWDYAFTTDTWVTFAIVKSSAGLRPDAAYADGTALVVASGAANNPLGATLLFGGRGTDSGWDGSISKVLIYSRALTEAEIDEVHAALVP